MRNRVPPGAALDSKRSSRTPTSGSSRSSSSGRSTASRARARARRDDQLPARARELRRWLCILHRALPGLDRYLQRRAYRTTRCAGEPGGHSAIGSCESRNGESTNRGEARWPPAFWTIQRGGKCESSARKNPTCRFGPSRERLRSRTLPPGDCSLSARSHQETERSLSDDEPASSAIGPTGKSRWSCRATAPLPFQKGEVRRSRYRRTLPWPTSSRAGFRSA